MRIVDDFIINNLNFLKQEKEKNNIEIKLIKDVVETYEVDDLHNTNFICNFCVGKLKRDDYLLIVNEKIRGFDSQSYFPFHKISYKHLIN